MKNRNLSHLTNTQPAAQRSLSAICALALVFAANSAFADGTNEQIPVAPSVDSPSIAKARELVRQRMEAIAQQEAASANSKAPAKPAVAPSPRSMARPPP